MGSPPRVFPPAVTRMLLGSACLVVLVAPPSVAAGPPAVAAGPPPGVSAVIGGAPALTRRAWTTEQGLPDNWVKAIAQTRDGYLWIGTQGGLARFDGVRFVVFNQRTQPDWPAEDVTALCGARNGDLWIGMLEGGLFRHRAGLFTQVPVPSRTVRALHEARDGTLWIALDRGLARLGPDGSPAPVEEFAGTYVYAFHEDPDGTLFLGTSRGLYVYRRDAFEPAGVRAGLPGRPVNSVWRDADQILWVGTGSAGLYRVDGPRVRSVPVGGGPIWDVLGTRRGNLWVASDHGLKTLHDERLWTPFAEYGLAGRVLVLFEDAEGNLWAGTRYSGVVRLTPGQVLSVGHELEFPSLLSVLEDRAGRVWFGSAGAGLGRLDAERLTTYGIPDGLTSDIVGPVFEDRSGRLWFGPRAGNRLQRVENGRVRSVPLEGTAASIHEDAQGSLWVGTTGHGLYRLRQKEVTHWTTQDGLPSRAVRVMVDDGADGLWLGTPRGLVHFRERPLVVYTAADGLGGDRITALHREPGGPLWIGAARGGLTRFADGRFTNYGPAQGLCDDQVLAILDDGLGSLWMSSSRGIFRVAKQQLNDVALGKRTAVSCTMYGRADGMESAQCNGGYQPSGWRARDGRLWFPTVKGLAVIDPSRLHAANAVVPPVWIEDVQADGQPVPVSGRPRLAAGTRRIEIDYTALSLVAPEKVRFRHRLSGFDSQWAEGDTRRRISYTNLRPGDYRFEVIASNNDGVWNERGAHWDFSVAPFLYQTRWFYGICALLVVAIGWGLHALRVRDLRLRNAVLVERTLLSQEIHDHISQIMTGIGLQLDAATQSLALDPGASASYLDRANRLTRQGIEETRVMLRNLRRGVHADAHRPARLDEALVESVAPLIEGTGVRLHARTEGASFPLAPDATHDILHVGQEAVANALRHGHARHVDIVLRFEPKGLRLTVDDDGLGFEPEDATGSAHRGLGLKGMASRMAGLDGTLDIRRRPSGGTTVDAFFPRNARVRG